MNALTYAKKLPIEEAPCTVSTALTTVEAAVAADEFVHASAIGLAMGGFGVFIVASWTGWAFGYTSMLIAVVSGIAAMYFGLLICLGRSAATFRGDIDRRSFTGFLGGHVQVQGGRVSGRDALVQIAFMPILLGVTMLFFAVYWLSVRG